MISSLELAKLCGVSQGTVDRALHNRKGISQKTKDKILKIAREHGYLPNPAARELITGKNLTVSAIIPQFNSIFYMDLLTAIKKKIAVKGFKLLISQYDSENELFELLSDFSARRICGSIVVPSRENIKINKNLSPGMKIISLLSPMTGDNICFITPDEEQTGIDAVDFFFSRGYRRIAHFTYEHPEHYAVRLRSAGYIKAMRQHELEPVIVFNGTEKDFHKTIQSHQIEAIFCHNDWLAITALQQFQAAGINVPEQISILGVDNSPTFNSLFSNLTTMDYPRNWIADETLKIITGQGKSTASPRMAVIPRNT
jgi:LacI family transcriptional regulator